MGKFNLLDEPWISVVIDTKGKTKEVSLKELFRNAHTYLDLAGDTKTQDFAVMRILLAVIHTVFSRFNAQGEEYGYFDLDERLRQVEKIDEEDVNDYREDLYMTWLALWKSQKFPEIVCEYLEKWRDRFYLFDEEHPFMQVRKEDIAADKINRPKASKVAGKNMNRLISESDNKIALFSPKYSIDDNKEKLKEAEIARWLITFQAYTGLSDKAIFGKEKYKSSKGWLFDLGGIYFKGSNLFEILLLNCVLVSDENGNVKNAQKPCWEFNCDDNIKRSFYESNMDSIAGLYTAWSRGLYMNPDFDNTNLFVCYIVKLPDIDHRDKFLEPMTIWKYNDSGDNKNTYTPRKHQQNKSMWRSFGLLTVNDKESNQRKPKLIEWFSDIKRIAKNKNIIVHTHPTLVAVSMQDNGNPTSWVPTDETVDSLSIGDFILTDLEENGWVERINEVVEKTKSIVGFTYKKYISDIKEIRNISSDLFTSQKVEDLYFKIDAPFRKWIAEIQYEDEKEIKTKEWWSVLYKLTTWEAQSILQSGSLRDYTGIEREGKIKNIATAYNTFVYFLNKEIGVEEVTSGDKE